MYHFVYKTISESGKYYIGRHSTKNLDDGYFGSGKCGELNPFFGKKHREESLRKMRQPRKTIICSHCGKIGSTSNMKRYHLDNCKEKING